MDINQIIDGKYIGYHADLSSLPIQKGDTVLIKKGTKYHSMRDGGYHIAGKSYKVLIDHVVHGAQYTHDGEDIVINSQLTWAGTGKYWNRVDINDVEKAKG